MVLLSMVAAHAPRLVVDQAALVLDVLHSAGGALQVCIDRRDFIQ